MISHFSAGFLKCRQSRRRQSFDSLLFQPPRGPPRHSPCPDSAAFAYHESSCDMHCLSAALRCLSALHDTIFLMPLPAATPMHSPVRLHPEAPSTRALMPTRISASPPPIASSKERPALEDHEPGVSATRRRRAPERAQTSKALLRFMSLVRKRARHR